MQTCLERRKYLRLNSVFPVTLQPISFHQPEQRQYQGFTRNVSLEGLCIETTDLDNLALNNLIKPQAKLRLLINMPLSSYPTCAIARVAWMKKTENVFPQQYLIGICYENIEQKAKKRIFAYARRVRNMPRYITAAFISLFIITALSLFWDFRSRCRNQFLVQRTVQLAKRYSELRKKLLSAKQREEQLKEELAQSALAQQKLREQIRGLEASIAQADRLHGQDLAGLLEEKGEIEQVIAQMQTEEMLLGNELARLREEKTTLNTDLETVEEQSQGLKQSAIQNMYCWIRTHQVHHSGLLVSFEGDRFLKDWAFTYDQALAAQVFTLFGDYANARKIFDFYRDKAEKVAGGFVNAYEVTQGKTSEYIVHCGPNIWLAIAVVQYTNISRDKKYLELAQSIAEWVIDIQSQDAEFGIRGGPKVAWFSTEHNLDAYALFNMLYTATGQRRYQVAGQRTLEWIKKYAYNGSYPPINRGKGDATIATDTFSWSICSLGPETLLQGGMDPEQIVQYAEDNCQVVVEYHRPDGKVVRVCGFDFSKDMHLPRGGVVSTEWTAQMVVAYKVLVGYFSRQGDYNKAEFYRQKVNFYLNELNKMVICSSSKTGQGQGCLPYASSAFADTGHGWRTPKGDKTGSLAATAYAIFAHLDYNPLSLSNQIGQRPTLKVSLSNLPTYE